MSRHAWLNPHAEFRLNDEDVWPPIAEVEKWPPAAPIPPHWYTRRALRAPRPARDPARPGDHGRAVPGDVQGADEQHEALGGRGGGRPVVQLLAALLDASGTALDRAARGRCWMRCRRRAGRPGPPCSARSVKKTSRPGPPIWITALRNFLLTPPSTVWFKRTSRCAGRSASRTCRRRTSARS